MDCENQDRNTISEMGFEPGAALWPPNPQELALRATLTVGGGLSGAVGGAGAGTALGFAAAGPAGAAVGFIWGFYSGLGVGSAAGWRSGRWLQDRT